MTDRTGVTRNKGRAWGGLILGLLMMGIPAIVGAQDVAAEPPPPTIDSGDTAWMLTSTALVLLMTPALAFFYGGDDEFHRVGVRQRAVGAIRIFAGLRGRLALHR
jgi:hypothetical protein